MPDQKTEMQSRIRASGAIDDARRTIDLARIRCLPFPQLIDRLRDLPNDNQASEIVLAVIETPRNGQQDRLLAAVLDDLLQLANTIPSRRREWLDRQVGRILATLPPRLSLPIARECLLHRRKSRRTAGFRSLSLKHIDEDLSHFLLEGFKASGDDRFLKALLAHPIQLGVIDPQVLLDAFEGDGYWMMRTIEAALRSDRVIGERHAAGHPVEFVWAAGRIGDRKFISKIASCFDAANDKLALVSIVVWAYGKLEAFEQLEDMQATLDELAREHAIN